METTTFQILFGCAVVIAIFALIRRMVKPAEKHYCGPATLTYRFEGEDREGDWLCTFTDQGKLITAIVYLENGHHKVGDVIKVENLGYGNSISCVSPADDLN